MKLDFLICGSANDGFFSLTAFARRSLDALGGIYRDARLVAAFAEYDRPELPARWARHFDNIEVIWANPEGLPNPGFDLQHKARFDAIRDDADVVVMCDADVCVMRPFDDLLEEIRRDDVLAGVMAHYHFPLNGLRGDPETDWNRISNAVLGYEVERPFQYLYGRCPREGAILNRDLIPRAPFYLNYGVVMGRPARLRQMYRGEAELRPAVAEICGTYWAAQIGLALACASLDIPVRALPPRYNYANRPETDRLYPEETNNIVLLHYMHERHFKRGALFHKVNWFDRFMDAPLSGSDEQFRQHILSLTEGRFPFPRTAADKRAER